MTELYEIQDIETLPGMDADLSEKMMPEEALRFVSGKSKEIRFDIDVPDNATADEIRKLAKEYFYHHYKELMDLSSVEIKLHPEGVLTHDTVFVGQIVRCVDLGRIGIVIRHKKGVKRRIPVLFSNGEVRSFEPHSLCPTTTAYHKMHFTPSPYTPGAPLEEGVIYDVTGTDEIPGMAVVTFSKTHKKKLRVRVNYLTTGNKRNVTFMDYEDLVSQLNLAYSQKAAAKPKNNVLTGGNLNNG